MHVFQKYILCVQHRLIWRSKIYIVGMYSCVLDRNISLRLTTNKSSALNKLCAFCICTNSHQITAPASWSYSCGCCCIKPTSTMVLCLCLCLYQGNINPGPAIWRSFSDCCKDRVRLVAAEKIFKPKFVKLKLKLK